jgi:3'-phosphoadenosine 5'-phosphosulfate sulfotransferase (PAPS reductase)/FAD synthetase
MRVVVIYRDESDHAREVIDYMRDYERQTGQALEVIDPDTRDGDQFCRTYDIVEYPTIIALTYDGIMQYLWRGRPLPTINEVSYYDRDN